MKINFAKTIKFCERNKDQNYRAIYSYIQKAIKYVKKLYDANPDLSELEINELIKEKTSNMTIEYTENADCVSEINQIVMSEEVLKDKKIIYEEYDKIKDMDLSNFIEGMELTFEDSSINSRENIKPLLAMLRKQKAELGEDTISDIKEYMNDKSKYTIPNKTRVSIEKIYGMISGEERDQLVEFIKQNKIEVEKILKAKYIRLMVQIGQFFETFELLDQMNAINDINMRRIGLEQLENDLDNSNNDKSKIAIKDLFDEDYLKTLDLEKLAILNTFWQNRFAKETKSINDGIFFLSTLNVFKDIKEGKKIEITPDMIDALAIKSSFMQIISKATISTTSQDVKKYEFSKRGNRIVYDPTEALKEFDEKYRDEYKKYFDKILPQSQNSLYSDIADSIILYTNKENIYFCKDATLMNLLNTFLNNEKIRNWGYIEEFGEAKKPITEKKYVLIGIDYEGFNMPLRVHMKREDLEDKLRMIKNNMIIPIYDGGDDFVYRNSIIKTQNFLPLDKNHKNEIRQLSLECKENDERYKFVKHLNFLRKADEFPEHLKEEVQEGRKTIKRRVRKYIDVSTGKMFTIEKKKYIPIDTDIGGIGKNDDGESER